MRARLGALLMGLALLAAAPLAGDEPAYLDFSAGENDARHQRDAVPEVGIGWRDGGRRWRPHLIAGGMLTSQGAFNAYGGIAIDLRQGSFVLRPSFAPGLYARGHGKDLGFPVAFRSGLEAAWQSERGVRVGAEFYHLSNWGLAHPNPGVNSLVLVVGIPTARLWGR